MGSVGVSTGSGAISRDAVVSLREGTGVIGEGYGEANTLLIYPNNYTTAETAQRSTRQWADRLNLDGASRGFAVAMSGATRAQKQALANALNRAYNLKQNRDEAYARRSASLIAKGEAWARSQGRSGLTAIERRALNEIARSSYQREQINKIIERDRRNGNKIFGGNIRTRNLRKSEY